MLGSALERGWIDEGLVAVARCAQEFCSHRVHLPVVCPVWVASRCSQQNSQQAVPWLGELCSWILEARKGLVQLAVGRAFLEQPKRRIYE